MTHSGCLPKWGNTNLPPRAIRRERPLLSWMGSFLSTYLCVAYGMEKNCNSRIAMFTKMPIQSLGWRASFA